jgi:hypothetical protein
MLESHFEQTYYRENGPRVIKRYVAYGLHMHGPALWRDSPDIDIIVPLCKSEDRNEYTVCVAHFLTCHTILMQHLKDPELFMQSDFVIGVVTPLLKHVQGSAEDFGFPIGAIALAAAAVRAYFY